MSERTTAQIPLWLVWAASGEALRAYAWLQCVYGDEGTPSQLKLGRDLGFSSRSTRKHLKELEDIGAITVVRRDRGSTNVYRLNTEAPKELES